MTATPDLAALCRRFGIDEAAARGALAQARAEPAAPWYVQAVIGLGGWLAALATLLFAGLLLHSVVGLEHPGPVAALAGAGLFAGALARKRQAKGLFAAHLATAGAVAGAILATLGLGLTTESLAATAAAAILCAAAAARFADDAILQFLLAAAAIAALLVAVADLADAGTLLIPSLLAGVGLALHLRPPRLDLRPAAAALLLAMPVAAILTDSLGPSLALVEGWAARAVNLALCLVLIGLRRELETDPAVRRQLAWAALAAALAVPALPPGGSGALVVLLAAHTLGHRPLAAIGALLAGYFIWRFYYDLDTSLLEKAAVLCLAGGCLLALWFVIARASPARPSAP